MSRRRPGLLASRAALLSLLAAALSTGGPAGAQIAPAGGWARPGWAEQVTLAPDGSPGSGAPEFCYSDLACGAQVAVSADGRYVAFNSVFDDLVEGDENGAHDVFVRDLLTGLTERISVAPDGSDADGPSAEPSISADGRYVAFTSHATNLTAQDGPALDVFVHDRATGATQLASRSPGGALGNGSSRNPTISGDGRYVAFFSGAFGDDTTNDPRFPYGGVNFGNVYLRDLHTATTELVSLGDGGRRSTSVSVYSSDVDLSHDGRYVAWDSRRHDLVEGDTNGMVDIFVRDRVLGSTERISVADDGTQGNWMAYNPAISADGSVVAFSAMSSNLVPSDTNGSGRQSGGVDVFVHDRSSRRTERLSVTSAGGETAPGHDSFWVDVSADGRFVVFDTTSPNLTGHDYERRILVQDRVTGGVEVASLAAPGEELKAAFAAPPAISADGSVVVFAGPNETSPFDDAVYARHRGAALGVAGVTVEQEEAGARVTGLATFSGRTLTAATAEPVDDPVGQRIARVEIALRPEHGDLHVRLGVPGLPAVRSGAPGTSYVLPAAPGGLPGARHGLRLEVDGRRYELRASRSGTGTSGTGQPQFALWACDGAVCGGAQPVAGGYGTVGEGIQLAVPLGLLGATAGSRLERLEAFWGLEAPGGVYRELGTLSLAAGQVPDWRVEVAAQAGGGAATEWTRADLNAGHFSAAVPPGSTPLVRACLGAVCSPAG